MSTSFPTSSSPAAAAAGPSSRPRPSAVLGLLAGAGAALLGVVLCALVGLIGWYLSDAGSHGEPNAGLLVGVRGWLVAHGAGMVVDGVSVTMVPLGITVLLAWTTWQVALRLGEAVWGHGPDEARAGDGERDFTVFLATAGFALGYGAVALVAASSTASDTWDPLVGAVLRWSLLFTVVLGSVAISIGSGRAAAWANRVPVVVQDAVRGSGAVLVAWLVVSGVLFVVAMVLGLGDAADMVQRLGTSRGETVLLVLGCLVLLPQAVLFSSAFLLGPGFAVGTGTAVAPAGVLLGPLPLVPILGALPDEGAAPGWWALHLAVPLVVALMVVVRRHHFLKITDWTASVCAGAGAGAGAALLLGILTAMADGAVGPGRMVEFGASAGNVLTAALVPFVGGGILGAAAATWWVRRSGVPVAPAVAVPEEVVAVPEENEVAVDELVEPAVEATEGDTEFTIPVVLIEPAPAPEPKPEPEEAEPEEAEAPRDDAAPEPRP